MKSPPLIKRFDIAHLHKLNGKLLEEAMEHYPKLFDAIVTHLTVPENTKHPIVHARHRYLYCGRPGNGSHDPAYWLQVAEKLDRPPSDPDCYPSGTIG